jgi:hypothetical protein
MHHRRRIKILAQSRRRLENPECNSDLVKRRFQNQIMLAISQFRLIHAMGGWQSSTARASLKHGQSALLQIIE